MTNPAPMCPACSREMGTIIDEKQRRVQRCLSCLGSWFSGKTIAESFAQTLKVEDFLAAGHTSLGTGTCPDCVGRLQNLEMVHSRGRLNLSHCGACHGFWVPSGDLIIFYKQWEFGKPRSPKRPLRKREKLPTPPLRDPAVSGEDRVDSGSTSPTLESAGGDPVTTVPAPPVKEKKIPGRTTSLTRRFGKKPRALDGIASWQPPPSPRSPPQTVVEFYRSHPYEDLGEQEAGWKSYIFSLITGLPLKLNHPCFYDSWVLFLIMLTGIYLSIYVAEILMPPQAMEGLILAFSAKMDTVTVLDFITRLFTYSFLHVSFPHFLVNMYFIWLFGSNLLDLMEERGPLIAWFSFALFLVLTGMLAGMAHVFLEDVKPVIGASGVASALMGAYWRVFPRAILYFVFIFFSIEETCGMYFVLFLFRTSLLAFLLYAGFPIWVSWQTYLGGFIAGYLLIPLFLPCNLEELQVEPTRED